MHNVLRWKTHFFPYAGLKYFLINSDLTVSRTENSQDSICWLFVHLQCAEQLILTLYKQGSSTRPQFIWNKAPYFSHRCKCHIFFNALWCTPVKKKKKTHKLSGNSAQTGSKWNSTACAPDPSICFHIDIKPSIRRTLSSSWQRLGCWLWHPVNN